ncbi:hypothetical protein [Calidifontibacillus erzurumensis]|uniref:hypothetical protein n=1 Tax=Calidifontibacillus erzurumensis TaxID=2741433 RepID=UPI0035B51888
MILNHIEIGSEIELAIKDDGTYRGVVCGLNAESIWVKCLKLINNTYETVESSIVESKNTVIFYINEIDAIRVLKKECL